MGYAFIQKAKNTSGTGTSIQQAYGSNVTAGSMLVAFATTDGSSSHTFSSTGDSWTTVAVFNDTGAGQFISIGFAPNATGGAKTVTCTFGAAGNFNGLIIAEFSGGATASPLDTNSPGRHNAASTTPTDASMNTAVDGDLILSVVMLDALGATVSAGSGFTLLDTDSNGMSAEWGVQATHGSIAGAFSLSASVANGILSAALKPAAAGASATYPPQALRSRRPVPFRVARSRQTVPVRAQVNPPNPIQEIAQPRRIRGLLPRRGQVRTPVPPQFNPPFPFVEVVQARRLRGWPMRRGRDPLPVPPPTDTPLFAETVQPRRLRGLLPRRGRHATPVPAQIILTPPAYPPQTVRARTKVLRWFRGRQAQPVPAQVTFTNPPFVPDRPHRTRLIAAVRRAHAALPPPADQPVFTAPRRRPWLPWVRRPKSTTAAPAHHGAPPGNKQARHPILGRLRRGLAVFPLKQQPPPPNPAFVPQISRRRLLVGVSHRGRYIATVTSTCTCTTHRPGSGTTVRPGSGTTARPNAGVTPDPCTC